MGGTGVRQMLAVLFTIGLVGQTISSPVNIPVQSVPTPLVQSAFNLLNGASPTNHIYKGWTLMSAQKLLDPPYINYKLTLNLERVCEGAYSCPGSVCVIDIKQHEENLHNIELIGNAILCVPLFPESQQNNAQEVLEQEIVENLDKQIINESVTLHHEVQDVTDQSDKPFIAVRASNYCPNCPYELNPALPGLEDFKNLAAESLDNTGRSDFKHKIINIVRVTRAVPPGKNVILYELVLEVGESNCLKSSQIERSECSVQSHVPVKFCLVQFEERPWAKNSRQLTHNNCTVSSDRINELDSKIEATFIGESMVTSNNDQDASQEESKSDIYDQVALEGQISTKQSPIYESLDVSIANRDEVTETPLTKILLATENWNDAPNKFTDKLKEFDDFLEDFDLPVKPKVGGELVYRGPVVIEDLIRPERVDSSEQPIVQGSRKKRSLSKEEEENLIRKMSQKAMDSLDNEDADDYKRKVVDILGLQKIIGAGDLYQVTILVANVTNCKEKTKEVNDCIQDPTIAMDRCKLQIQVADKTRFENAKFIKPQCESSEKEKPRVRRDSPPLGAPRDISIKDETVKEFVSKGLNTYSQNYGTSNAPIVVNLISATQQIVSGTKYKIKVLIGESDCPKNVKSLEGCNLQKGSNTKECLITVWSQPWLSKEEIKVKCEDESNKARRKRSLRGVGYSTKHMKMAEEFLSEAQFIEYEKNFGKVYASEEERQVRKRIFQENMKTADHLQQNEQGTAIYGATIFADMTPNEFRLKHLGYRSELRSENDIPLAQAEIPDVELPQEFDWRHYNAVTPVKNQGSCGSCWAFSVTGNVEGQYAIKHGKLLSLSEQELVDCDKLDEGCNGGLQENAYRAIEEMGGLELEQDYPYDGEDETCHFKKGLAKVKLTSAVNITSNETQMAQWLVKNGPMAIAINANAMQFYMGGISHPFKFLCNKNNLDHGVLIVGYGVHTYPIFKKTLPFWIVKNSWGTGWGEKGYYRVFRGDGTCGLNADVSSAIIA